MTFSRMAKSSGCALAALALAGAAAGSAVAASSLRDSLGASADDRFRAPMEGRFRSESGAMFVLDRGPAGALMMRFEASPEIWVLKPQLVNRGDVVYKNDLGEQMLRATRVGGLTVFTPEAPGGAAAAFVGDGPNLRLLPVPTPSALLQSLTLASARAGRAAQQTVPFHVKDAPLSSWAVVADAAQVTAQAFQQVATRRDKVRHLLQWRQVELLVGKTASVSGGADGTLMVTVNADGGPAGRPSSRRIAEVLGRAPPRR